jgi:hypothetical protein
MKNATINVIVWATRGAGIVVKAWATRAGVRFPASEEFGSGVGTIRMPNQKAMIE